MRVSGGVGHAQTATRPIDRVLRVGASKEPVISKRSAQRERQFCVG